MIRNLWNTLIAALSFFTRLPFWRLGCPTLSHYEHVVPMWPFAGWITGGVMCACAFIFPMFIPLSLSVVIILTTRILITGALHEDGFADFCDGMGGGSTRERILEIMKDSHIGTYGVIGLVIILLSQFFAIRFIVGTTPASCANLAVIPMADISAKFLSASIIRFLPYARNSNTAKNKLVYSRPTISEFMVSLVGLLIPIVVVMIVCGVEILTDFAIPFAASTLSCTLLFLYMKRRIDGYTGDCCGATFIITELTFYLAYIACVL